MAERSLAHIEKIAWVKPISSADNIEKIGILGWTLIAKKGEFQVGDLACFFEIDSLLPQENWSEFMAAKHYKVKTMKLSKFEKETGGVISQGLALPISDIPKLVGRDWKVGDDVTDLLGVTYHVPEDNIRKANPDSKSGIKRVAAYHPAWTKQRWFRWLSRREWGRKLLCLLFDHRKENERHFPKKFEFVTKTDEMRIEAIDQEWLFSYKEPLIQTLKIDGTSSTYILERLKNGKTEYYVCSRNVRQLTPNQKTYHDDNVYWNAEFKYHIKDFLQDQLDQHPDWKYVCLQGEIAGEGIQGNPHGLIGQNFFGFNFIDSEDGRWNSVKAKEFCKRYDIPWVPIINTHYILPDDMETLKLQADGPCDIAGATGLREGFVYRGIDNPMISFKNVSRQYLLSHGG